MVAPALPYVPLRAKVTKPTTGAPPPPRPVGCVPGLGSDGRLAEDSALAMLNVRV